MGLLDDAIRDHLDLRRRHGADPAELERAEREALGPVRRKRDGGDSAQAVDEVFDGEQNGADADGAPLAYDQDADDWAYGDDFAAPSADHDAEPEPDPEPASRSRSRRSGSGHGDDDDQPRGLAARFGLRGRRSEADEHVDDEPDVDQSEPEPRAPEDQPTQVHATERPPGRRRSAAAPAQPEPDADAAADSGAEEDVLEETPEFLQDETTDHDKLWFEQRPPRDFDFDG